MNIKDLINKNKKEKQLGSVIKDERIKLLFGMTRYHEKERLEENPYFIMHQYDVEVNFKLPVY